MRILHKVAALCHTSLFGSGTQYLSDLTQVYTLARSLRFSSDTHILRTPNIKLRSYGQRYCTYHGLTVWNSLPLALRHQQESDCFKQALKTHLFSLNKELNTIMVFCYFHFLTISTTLVINK